MKRILFAFALCFVLCCITNCDVIRGNSNATNIKPYFDMYEAEITDSILFSNVLTETMPYISTDSAYREFKSFLLDFTSNPRGYNIKTDFSKEIIVFAAPVFFFYEDDYYFVKYGEYTFQVSKEADGFLIKKKKHKKRVPKEMENMRQIVEIYFGKKFSYFYNPQTQMFRRLNSEEVIKLCGDDHHEYGM